MGGKIWKRSQKEHKVGEGSHRRQVQDTDSCTVHRFPALTNKETALLTCLSIVFVAPVSMTLYEFTSPRDFLHTQRRPVLPCSEARTRWKAAFHMLVLRLLLGKINDKETTSRN